ncbi:MAG: sialate O-acetylesterase [Kiritimatiellae bacterium]|nr:sialate O-acetylesterase [Kiritimatiellia bacterium]
MNRKVLAVGFVLGWVVAVRAEVRLPAILGSDMVLQRGVPVRLWGWADAGEQVTVTAGGQRKTATADAAGAWQVMLDPLVEGAPLMLVFEAANTITLTNVLVGEVWVCSGQSNMAMALRATSEAATDIPGADYPQIRLFSVKRTLAHEPKQDCAGRWVLCSPATARDFTAAGFYFGRQIHLARKTPVGLINSSWGATPAEAWTSRAAMAADPKLAPILAEWQTRVEHWDPERAKANHAKRLAKWEEEAAAAKAAGKKPNPKPSAPVAPLKDKHYPGVLYNAMIVPLTPLQIRGAIWYQGESNAGRAVAYRTLFPAMIRCWREAWAQGEFPFLFVQLPNYRKVAAEPGPSRWAELREAQLRALSLPNTGMAITIDIGEANNIHPKNKRDVGERLARVARQMVYGEPITGSGPVYESIQREGNRMRIRFSQMGKGLVTAGGKPLTHFAIAGEDRTFVWAKAEIDGDTVVVSSDKVDNPVAVRYAWADDPEGCNLFNSDGLPASPFRTDDWPVGPGAKPAMRDSAD